MEKIIQHVIITCEDQGIIGGGQGDFGMKPNIIAVIAMLVVSVIWLYNTDNGTSTDRVITAADVREKEARQDQENFLQAVDKGSVEALLASMAKQIDVNYKYKNGNTALHIATSQGDYDKVTALLENGADINSINDYSRTALHVAVLANSEKVIPLLLLSGIDYKYRDNDGRLALDIAEGNYYHRIIKMLKNLPYQ